MNDVVTPQHVDDSNAVTQPGALSAGTILRNAREAAGLHVAALAVSMKVPVKKLEALEADRLDLLPDAVFVRALASSVCRALKIDPAPVLQRLPQNAVPRLDAEERGINAPFHSPGQAHGLTVPAFLAKPAVLAVVALLIGVVAVVFFPEIQKQEHAADIPAPVLPASVEVAPAPAEPVLVAVPASAPNVLAAPVAALSVTVPPAPAAAVVAAPAPVEAAKAAVSAPVVSPKMVMPGAAVDVAGATAGLVVFKVRGPSWVEVTDGKGVVQLRKTLASGETIAASGALPLSVVVGRADVTDVDVRGKPFSLAGIAKDNVARFEVK